MTRLLFALALLAGATLSTPTADATFVPDAVVLAAGAEAPDAAAGMACYRQGNQLHCNELPPDWDCARLQDLFDANNAGGGGVGGPITMVRCQDAARIAFLGQTEVEVMRVGPRGIEVGGDREPWGDSQASWGGGYTPLLLVYNVAGRMEMVEAGEGSDIGALLAIAAASASCGARELPFTVVSMVTEGPGQVQVNGHRIEVEQVAVTVKPSRTSLYGEILISGEPIEFED